MEIFLFVAQCVYFFLPVYIANSMPVFAAKMGIAPYLARPVDFGKKLMGQPLLGSHKTFRGFVAGTAGAIAATIAQALLYLHHIKPFPELSIVEYSLLGALVGGFLLGFGSLVGDSAGSFLKRRLKIQSGQTWLFGDQLGMAVGAIAFTMPIYGYNWKIALTLLMITFVLHVGAEKMSYLLHLRKKRGYKKRRLRDVFFLVLPLFSWSKRVGCPCENKEGQNPKKSE